MIEPTVTISLEEYNRLKAIEAASLKGPVLTIIQIERCSSIEVDYTGGSEDDAIAKLIAEIAKNNSKKESIIASQQNEISELNEYINERLNKKSWFN